MLRCVIIRFNFWTCFLPKWGGERTPVTLTFPSLITRDTAINERGRNARSKRSMCPTNRQLCLRFAIYVCNAAYYSMFINLLRKQG